MRPCRVDRSREVSELMMMMPAASAGLHSFIIPVVFTLSGSRVGSWPHGTCELVGDCYIEIVDADSVQSARIVDDNVDETHHLPDSDPAGESSLGSCATVSAVRKPCVCPSVGSLMMSAASLHSSTIPAIFTSAESRCRVGSRSHSPQQHPRGGPEGLSVCPGPSVGHREGWFRRSGWGWWIVTHQPNAEMFVQGLSSTNPPSHLHKRYHRDFTSPPEYGCRGVN